MSGQGKILVIRGGAIGDFILTLPVLAALRERFHTCHIEVLGYPHIVQLAVASGLADRAQSIEARALAGFFAHLGEVTEDLALYFSEFDLIVSYLYDPDGIFQTNVARCSPAQFLVGPHRPNDQAGLHASQVFLKPLEHLAIFDADPVPRLRLSGAARGNGQIALHPGSGSERKNWPEKHWARFLEDLVNRSRLNLLLVGGEAEGERLQQLAAALPPSRTRVAQSLPLPDLGRLLQACEAFIGHDSGITHLAAALQIPTLALWGESVQEVWRPLGENVTILKRTEGLLGVTPEQMWLTLKSFEPLASAGVFTR